LRLLLRVQRSTYGTLPRSGIPPEHGAARQAEHRIYPVSPNQLLVLAGEKGLEKTSPVPRFGRTPFLSMKGDGALANIFRDDSVLYVFDDAQLKSR